MLPPSFNGTFTPLLDIDASKDNAGAADGLTQAPAESVDMPTYGNAQDKRGSGCSRVTRTSCSLKLCRRLHRSDECLAAH